MASAAMPDCDVLKNLYGDPFEKRMEEERRLQRLREEDVRAEIEGEKRRRSEMMREVEELEKKVKRMNEVIAEQKKLRAKRREKIAKKKRRLEELERIVASLST